MATLILLRHAKSDWSGGEPDADRPLAPRGIRQAPQAGAWLAGYVRRLDLAVVSPAVRARATWDLVSAELDERPEVVLDERVYAASGRELLAVVGGLPPDAETVVLVGHNPGLEELVSHLTGETVELKTSAIAVVDLPSGWAEVDAGGTLETAGRPPG